MMSLKHPVTLNVSSSTPTVAFYHVFVCVKPACSLEHDRGQHVLHRVGPPVNLLGHLPRLAAEVEGKVEVQHVAKHAQADAPVSILADGDPQPARKVGNFKFEKANSLQRRLPAGCSPSMCHWLLDSQIGHSC